MMSREGPAVTFFPGCIPVYQVEAMQVLPYTIEHITAEPTSK
jgi:hypothetical protein